jgi:hypothetical protein
MRLSKDEYLQRLQSFVGDNTNEDALSLIEDFTDTYNELESASNPSVNWEQKYKENDEAWKKKYRDRFFNPPAPEETKPEQPEEDEKEITINDLFK